MYAIRSYYDNLRAYAWGSEDCPPFDWATRFEQKVRNLLVEGDDSLLVDYESLGEDAKQSIPTPEHYLPLLYVLGARRQDEAVITSYSIHYTKLYECLTGAVATDALDVRLDGHRGFSGVNHTGCVVKLVTETNRVV